MEFQYALCVTFFHSLWIGLVVVLLTSLIVISTKKSPASLRYNLLTGLLFLFVLSMSLVFYNTLKQGGMESASVRIGFSSPDSDQSVADAVLRTGNSPVQEASGMMKSMNMLMKVWTSYSSEIVLIWFLILCFKCIHLLMGLHAVNHLKNNQTTLAGSYYEQKVRELSLKLGISKGVQIFQSAITRVPVVAGHFKPVILLPLGLLNGLSTAEVEAIISHELAHIKRSDYLVNILQSLVEIIFFFNPAVLWLSNLIKEEREHCCDDLALSCAIDKQDYIKALVFCQEFQSDTNSYAMAFSGRKNQLLERVSRMVLNRSSSLNRIEKTVMTLTLISVLIFTAAFTEGTKKPEVVKTPVVIAAGSQLYQDSIPKKSQLRKTVSPKVAASGVSDQSKKKKTQEELRKADIDRQIKAAADRDWVKHEVSRKQAEKAKAAADRDWVKHEVSRKQAEKAKAAADRDWIKHEISRKQAEKAKAVADREVPVKPATPEYKSAAPKSPVVAAAKEEIGQIHVVEDDSDPKFMTQELRNDGLLQNSANFQYKLNKDELIIDGVRQRDAIHQKYAKKYLKNRKGTITTTVSTD